MDYGKKEKSFLYQCLSINKNGYIVKKRNEKVSQTKDYILPVKVVNNDYVFYILTFYNICDFSIIDGSILCF